MKRTAFQRRTPFRSRCDPIIAQLDDLCRQATFRRDGFMCRRCRRFAGQPSGNADGRVILEWCHLRSRRYHSTRWDGANVLALCKGCHLWQHQNPGAATAWWHEQIGPREVERLRIIAGTRRRPQYAAVALALKAGIF